MLAYHGMAQPFIQSVGANNDNPCTSVGRNCASLSARMAPIDKPRIVVAVMIDEPSNGKYFGGDVAAPVFSDTVAQTLRMMGVTPDMNVKPQIVAKAVEESF